MPHACGIFVPVDVDLVFGPEEDSKEEEDGSKKAHGWSDEEDQPVPLSVASS
jgi:hypothetical protein